MLNAITNPVESCQRGIKGYIQRINRLLWSMAGLSLHATEEKELQTATNSVTVGVLRCQPRMD